MVEHWSEKPGVDSSILSLGILFRPNFVQYFVARIVGYLHPSGALPTVYLLSSRRVLRKISLKKP